MSGFFRLCIERSVVRRALRTMLLVGPILIAINQGDALVRGDVDGVRAVRMALTLLVPYAVSTSSSVAALKSQAHSH